MCGSIRDLRNEIWIKTMDELPSNYHEIERMKLGVVLGFLECIAFLGF